MSEQSIGDRIRDWDDGVEELGAPEDEATRPFEAGVMLAVATLLDAWDEDEGAQKNSRDAFRDAIKGLLQTAEAVIE